MKTPAEVRASLGVFELRGHAPQASPLLTLRRSASPQTPGGWALRARDGTRSHGCPWVGLSSTALVTATLHSHRSAADASMGQSDTLLR